MKIEQFCFLRHAGSWDAYLYNTLILDILEKHYIRVLQGSEKKRQYSDVSSWKS